MGQVEGGVRQKLLSSKSTFGSELNRAGQNITTIGRATSGPACLKYLLERWEQGMWMEEPSQTLTRLLERNCPAARARQNGDHRDR